jgi:hypothetical protein
VLAGVAGSTAPATFTSHDSSDPPAYSPASQFVMPTKSATYPLDGAR